MKISNTLNPNSMTQEEREIAIEHTIDLVSDLVPYNTSNYWDAVRKMAEEIVDAKGII